MATRGTSMSIQYVAWDTANNTGKTGDAANHTLRWVKDGTASAPTNSPSEVDATNAPGVCKLTLTATEADCNIGTLAGKSSTLDVVIIPVTIQFERLPDAAPGTSGGVPLKSDLSGLSTFDPATDRVQASVCGTVTNPVTLTASYDACKTAAQAGDAMALTATAISDIDSQLTSSHGSGTWSSAATGDTYVTHEDTDDSGETMGITTPGATVTAYLSSDTDYSNPLRRTTAEPDGQWGVYLTPGATYTLVFAKDGYETRTRTVTVS